MIRNIRTTNASILRRSRTGLPGLTLIELLVAAMILILSLAGLGAAWLVAAQNSARVDSDAAAYECARMVMERVHGFGYIASTYFNPGSTAVSPRVDGLSMAAQGDTLKPAWQSRSLQQYRYFDASLAEVGNPSTQDGVSSPTPPAGTAYVATTTVNYPSPSQPPADASNNSQNNSQYARDDLVLMSVTVTVQQVNSDGSLSAPLISITSLMTEGGL